MFKPIWTLLTFLVISFVVIVPLVDAQADVVDDYIKTMMKKTKIPGLALAVVKNGQVIKAQGYGLANLELNVPVTPDSVFELASVTKMFTATAIMMLVEEGKVALDDNINKYLINAPYSWRDITVRHLLTHTASLSWNPEKVLPPLERDSTTAWVFEQLSEFRLDFAPGERWQYFDQGYRLLGMIIEKQSGKRYREFVRERIFQPLGMKTTTLFDLWAIIKNRASGYWLRDGKLAHSRRGRQHELLSHSGILSTVKDLAKWDAALYTEKLLKKTSLDQMWTPVKLNNGLTYPYGFGWLLFDHRGFKRISHGGVTGTHITRFLEEKLTVIVLTNLGGADKFLWQLALGVAGLYNPGLLPPYMLQEQPDPDPQRTQKLQDFLVCVAHGKESGSMTAGLRAIIANQPGYLVESFKDIKSLKFLACDEVADRGVEVHGASVSRICHYKVVTEQETLYVAFYLTEKGKVAEFGTYRDFLH
jgi:CubicO group peptidase (beta-lactamase class C family)